MNYKFDRENHIHSLDGKPLIGTSTTIQVISKPLTWWAAELAAVAALESGDHIPTIRAEYEEACKRSDKKKAIDALQRKYPAFKKARFAHFEKKNDAADKGTDMHEELERYIKHSLRNFEGKPYESSDLMPDPTITFADWAMKNVKRFLVSEGYCYSEKLWTGGITDCIAELNDGRLVIIDFKSSKEAYLSQFIQVAGYDIEASENGIFDEDGNLILKLEHPIDGYIIFPFGAEKVEPQFQFDTVGIRKGFESAVVLHKLINAEK